MARIDIAPDQCIGAGQCVLSASDVFDQDDDGFVVVLEGSPEGSDLQAARDAVDLCPSRSIRVIED